MSVADDGKILAKLPKVKVLRNNQREGELHLSLLRINLQLTYIGTGVCTTERQITCICILVSLRPSIHTLCSTEVSIHVLLKYLQKGEVGLITYKLIKSRCTEHYIEYSLRFNRAAGRF